MEAIRQVERLRSLQVKKDSKDKGKGKAVNKADTDLPGPVKFGVHGARNVGMVAEDSFVNGNGSSMANRWL